MNHKRQHPRDPRRGAIVVLGAFTMVLLVSMLAFGVDYGWLVQTRTNMQRSADAAALAAVQDLIPAPNGAQDVDAARETARAYVRSNLSDESFNVSDDDIEIGRYDASTIYSSVTLLNSGPYDSVRVTLRRDGQINPRAALFFARALGIDDAGITVTATAVLQRGTALKPGAGVLPFAIHTDVWDAQQYGDAMTIYGDGQLEDLLGNPIPGNWGTVDIGAANNSTSDLRDQIINGLRQDDLDDLHEDGRISQDTHIDGSESLWLQADPGLSSGMSSAVEEIEGEQRMIPIYDQVAASGGDNAEFHIVGWAVVTVVDSRWAGTNNTSVTVQKSYMYEGNLVGTSSRLDSPALISGVFSSPVLVE